MQEADWHIFSTSGPPPSYAQQSSGEDEHGPAANKRPRETSSSASPARPAKKRDQHSQVWSHPAFPGARTHVSDSEINPSSCVTSPASPHEEEQQQSGQMQASSGAQSGKKPRESPSEQAHLAAIEAQLSLLTKEVTDLRSKVRAPSVNSQETTDESTNHRLDRVERELDALRSQVHQMEGRLDRNESRFEVLAEEVVRRVIDEEELVSEERLEVRLDNSEYLMTKEWEAMLEEDHEGMKDELEAEIDRKVDAVEDILYFNLRTAAITFDF
ncbi:hypothetical protein MPH_13664 [Macrophomina phaseolina MS6]|uniref:Uncharacterized protein n=1 Tax=Macrophomina phaseolina (strain MS6) TaxID=1126212 RepID=K2R526_MACPH|nr:hypothetical protein MPH_13664 [Macrophomina phaseolina MS6]